MENENTQNKYDEIFREIKEEKMNWDFEDFLKQAEESEKDEKIILLKAEKANPSFPNFFWMAAAVALLLGVFFLTKMLNQKPTVQEQDDFVKNQIQQQKKEDFLVVNEAENQDSIQIKEKDSVVQNMVPEKEAEEVMNKILSKKSRLKRSVKQRYAAAEPKKIEKPTAKSQKPEYHENFVIINGHKIEDEKEAIDVAKYSLQMLSNQVSKTVAKADPLTDYSE